MRLRLDRGWSLRQLSRVTRVSYQYLGNLEHGHKAPSERVAEICDRTLIGDGTLLALALSVPREARSPESMSGDESEDSVIPSVGPVSSRPRAPCSPDGLGGDGEPVPLTDPEAALLAQREAFLQAKAAAQTERSGEVFPAVARRAELCASVAAVRGPGGQDHWLWAARFAELAGWMAQEAGWTACADQWTDAAVRWAACGGDRDMAAYAWERRSLVPFCRGDARAAVDLAGAGAAAPAGARVRGLAECRVAQGLALAGDADGCRRALDRARVLLTAQTEPPPSGADDMPWGSGSMPAIPAFVEAWCLIDLGRAAQAVELFGSVLECSVSPRALRTRTRYVVRAALAFAGSGEHVHAEQLIKELLPTLAQVDSASVRADTRNLIRLLSRRRIPALAGLLPDLHNIARCAPQP